MPKNKTPTKVGVHLLINGGWIRPAGATLLRKMVSPFGPTATPPQPKNSPPDCFLNALFESKILLCKLLLPPTAVCNIKNAKKNQPLG